MFLFANLGTVHLKTRKRKKSRPKNWNVVILDTTLAVMFTNSTTPSTTIASQTYVEYFVILIVTPQWKGKLEPYQGKPFSPKMVKRLKWRVHILWTELFWQSSSHRYVRRMQIASVKSKWISNVTPQSSVIVEPGIQLNYILPDLKNRYSISLLQNLHCWAGRWRWKLNIQSLCTELQDKLLTKCSVESASQTHETAQSS